MPNKRVHRPGIKPIQVAIQGFGVAVHYVVVILYRFSVAIHYAVVVPIILGPESPFL